MLTPAGVVVGRLAIDMQIISGIIVVGFMLGVVLGLFFTLRSGRRSSRRIDAQLSGEILPTQRGLVIGANRRKRITACGALVFWMLVVTQLLTGDTLLLGVALEVVLGSALAMAIRRARYRDPLLVLDDYGISFVRTNHTFAWGSCERIYVKTSSIWPDHHSLICELRPDAPELARHDAALALGDRTVQLRLDALSMPWNDVVAECQSRIGSHLVTE